MRNLIRLTVFMFVLNVAVSCSSMPGYVNVQLNPEQGKVEYIRVYEKDKKHLARDLMPMGKGKYEAVYTNPADVTVIVKAKKKKELSQDAHVEPGQYAYMEFNVTSEKTEVEFIRMKASREFQFKPIHKGKKKKSIYISYIDYIGQNLGLTKKLEENLRAMGYNVLKSVDDHTELIATINLVDFSTTEHPGGVNRQQVNKYKFKIGIEQRITGSSELQESYSSARMSSEEMTYSEESYPLDDSEKVESPPAEPTPVPVVVEEKPGSPGLLVLMGMAEDEKKEEGEAAPAEDPAKTAVPPNEEKKGEKKEEKPSEEVEANSEPNSSGIAGFQNSTQVVAKSKLKYRPFRDEIMIDASLRLINLSSKDENAVNQIVSLLSNRLAQIFNL